MEVHKNTDYKIWKEQILSGIGEDPDLIRKKNLLRKRLEIIRTTSFIWFWRRSGLTESGLTEVYCIVQDWTGVEMIVVWGCLAVALNFRIYGFHGSEPQSWELKHGNKLARNQTQKGLVPYLHETIFHALALWLSQSVNNYSVWFQQHVFTFSRSYNGTRNQLSCTKITDNMERKPHTQNLKKIQQHLRDFAVIYASITLQFI